MDKSVVSISGGLDSTTLLHYIVKVEKQEVYPISFFYGQKHKIELIMADYQVKQLQWAGHMVHDLKIIDMSFFKDLVGGATALVSDNIEIPSLKEVIGQPQPITEVPFRNLIFSSLCLAYAESNGCSSINLGLQSVDAYSYWDTSVEFGDRLNYVADLNRVHKIKIRSPFVNLCKAEEILIGMSLGVDFKNTWTSYKVIDEEKRIADSANPSSNDRIKSFAIAGLKDPTTYEKVIDWDSLISKYRNPSITLEKALSNVVKYNK